MQGKEKLFSFSLTVIIRDQCLSRPWTKMLIFVAVKVVGILMFGPIYGGAFLAIFHSWRLYTLVCLR